MVATHPGGLGLTHPATAPSTLRPTPTLKSQIEHVVLGDADGALIAYGDRWCGDSPPSESYSVLTNVERFGRGGAADLRLHLIPLRPRARGAAA